MGCHAISREWTKRRRSPDWRVHRFTPDATEWLERSGGLGGLAVSHETTVDALEQLISDSAELLDDGRERDEEEAGACGPAARDRAIEFLRAHAAQATRLGFVLPLPRISTGPEGSIDLHWQLDGFELLVNFPANAEEPATFYGDNQGSDSIRGTIGSDPDSRSLLPWLVATR